MPLSSFSPPMDVLSLSFPIFLVDLFVSLCNKVICFQPAHNYFFWSFSMSTRWQLWASTVINHELSSCSMKSIWFCPLRSPSQSPVSLHRPYSQQEVARETFPASLFFMLSIGYEIKGKDISAFWILVNLSYIQGYLIAKTGTVWKCDYCAHRYLSTQTVLT